MRVRTLLLPAAAAALFVSAPASALEKTAARFSDDPTRRDWQGFGTVSIAYYNTCNGWVWVWGGWTSHDRLGVFFENPCYGEPEHLLESRVFVATGAPSGYGYTGTVEMTVATPEGCLGEILEQRPFLPTEGWNDFQWSARLRKDLGFAMIVTMGPGTPNPAGFVTDHPAAASGGPPPCGTCYPSTRVGRSYMHPGSDPCPGTPFYDGTCAAELLFEASVFCNDYHSAVTPSSWGSVKNLYR